MKSYAIVLFSTIAQFYQEVGKIDESALIKKVKDGDLEAFSELVKQYEKRAFNFAYRTLKDTHLAEDATQEAFLRVYSKIDTFRGNSSFSTWFYTILNNICLDFLRKKSRSPDTVSIGQTSSDDEEYELQIEDKSPTPHESLEKKDANALLEQALSELSYEHRVVIILRDIEGREYEEIAKILNISLGTVKSRLSRARLSLRKILEKEKELFL